MLQPSAINGPLTSFKNGARLILPREACRPTLPQMLAGIVRHLPLAGLVELINELLFDRNDHALTAHSVVQLASDGQHRVSNLFRVQSSTWKMPKQSILWIDLAGVSRL